MAIDTSIPRTRRALLAGGLGGVAALVASAFGRPLPARAGSDGDVILGNSDNIAGSVTKITTTEGGGVPDGVGAAIWGASATGSGVFGSTSIGGTGVEGSGGLYGYGVAGYGNGNFGVRGLSTNYAGVYGESAASVGVYGYTESTTRPSILGRSTDYTGIQGYSGPQDTNTLPDVPAKTGVHGLATQDAKAIGVYGKSTAGRGIYGQATSGAGVYGYATTGYALRAVGRVKVDKASGVATITATTSSVVVTPGLDVTSTSFVLLTPKADLSARRLWYTTNPTENTITIRVSSAVTANVQVGWLLLG